MHQNPLNPTATASPTATATPAATASSFRRASLAGLLAAGLLAAVPGAASAASIARDGATLRFQGTDAAESVLVSFDDEPGVVRFTMDDAPTSLPAGCRWDEGYGAYCPIAGATTVVANLAGGNDRFTTFPGATTAIVADGAAGDDVFWGADEPATFLGGPGNDQLFGHGGDDTLDGGDGNDKVEGGEGADRVLGGAGSDQLMPDPINGVWGDAVDGGPGFDEIELYSVVAQSLGPVDLSLDGGGADGYPGEGDDIRGVEKLIVHQGGTVTGSEAADDLAVWGESTVPARVSGRGGNDVIETYKADDALDGGAGDDRLVGGFGNDTITGGPGRDTIIADTDGSYCNEWSCTLPYGNDTIDARDGEADQVDCGVGTDTVYADAVDTVAPSCESVVLGAAPGTPGAPAGSNGAPQPGGGSTGPAITAKTTKLRTALTKGLKLQLTGLPQGKTKVRARRGRTVVATGSARISAGGTATVRLTFTKAAQRSLNGRKKVSLQVTAAGKTAAITLSR